MEINPIVERVARALCTSRGDNPNMLAYPPMIHDLAMRSNLIIYVPTAPHQQPRPCWVWYVDDAKAAIRGTAAAIEAEAAESRFAEDRHGLMCAVESLREAIA
jgi:hypothetical protein